MHFKKRATVLIIACEASDGNKMHFSRSGKWFYPFIVPSSECMRKAGREKHIKYSLGVRLGSRIAFRYFYGSTATLAFELFIIFRIQRWALLQLITLLVAFSINPKNNDDR